MEPDKQLESIRERIDAIDSQLLELISERGVVPKRLQK